MRRGEVGWAYLEDHPLLVLCDFFIVVHRELFPLERLLQPFGEDESSLVGLGPAEPVFLLCYTVIVSVKGRFTVRKVMETYGFFPVNSVAS